MDALFNKTGTGYILSFERSMPHPPEKVWRVLTERELLRQWFPCDVQGEWKSGAKLKFIFMHGEGEGLSEDELSGEVLAADPPHNLEFRWGKYFYRCQLIPEGDGCRLIFSESFDDASMGARSAAGWEMCFENMDLILEGASAAKFAVNVLQKKFQYYAIKFEREAGPQQGIPGDYLT